MHNIFYILIISYVVGVNIAAFTMLTIQKREYNRVKMKFILDNNLDEETLKINLSDNETSKEIKDENKRSDSLKTETDGTADENQTCECNSEICPPTPDACLSDRERLRKYSKFRISNEQHKQLLKFQKKKCMPDFILLIVAAAGGAIALYVSMFIHRFKLKNIMFMLVVPLLCGLNIFLLIQFFTVWIVVA